MIYILSLILIFIHTTQSILIYLMSSLSSDQEAHQIQIKDQSQKAYNYFTKAFLKQHVLKILVLLVILVFMYCIICQANLFSGQINKQVIDFLTNHKKQKYLLSEEKQQRNDRNNDGVNDRNGDDANNIGFNLNQKLNSLTNDLAKNVEEKTIKKQQKQQGQQINEALQPEKSKTINNYPMYSNSKPIEIQHVRNKFQEQKTQLGISRQSLQMAIEYIHLGLQHPTRNLIEKQKQYYENKYQFSKTTKELPICVVIPSYNNFANIRFMFNLKSILDQDYSNYHIVYLDDNSNDHTGSYTEKYLIKHKVPDDKYKIIRNQERKGYLYNIRMAAQQYCKPHELIFLVDGDDGLVGTQVFKLFNHIYQQNDVWFVYGNYIDISNGVVGSSRSINAEKLESGELRKQASMDNLPIGHLKTFYNQLFLQVPQKYLMNPDSKTYFSDDNSKAMIYSMLELLKDSTKLYYLSEIVYLHNDNTQLSNEPLKEQILTTIKSFPILNHLPQLYSDQPKVHSLQKNTQYTPFFNIKSFKILEPQNINNNNDEKIRQHQISQNHHEAGQNQPLQQAKVNSQNLHKDQQNKNKDTLSNDVITKFQQSKDEKDNAIIDKSEKLNQKSQSNAIQAQIFEKKQNLMKRKHLLKPKEVEFVKKSSNYLPLKIAFPNDFPMEPESKPSPQTRNQKAKNKKRLTAAFISNQSYQRAIQYIHLGTEHPTKEQIQIEKNYYQGKYKLIDAEDEEELSICMLITSYNNLGYSRFIFNLKSVLDQDYDNYHIVYIDDASPDFTSRFVQSYMIKHKVPDDKYIIIRNQERKGYLYNIRMAAQQYCKPHELIFLVDGDDGLAGTQVFKLFNHIYQQNDVWFVYGNYIDISNGVLGSSRSINAEKLESGELRKQASMDNLPIGHLKTFYNQLFLQVPQKYLMNPDSKTYFSDDNSKAMIYSMLELLKDSTKLYYLPEIVYLHNDNTQLYADTFSKKSTLNDLAIIETMTKNQKLECLFTNQQTNDCIIPSMYSLQQTEFNEM